MERLDELKEEEGQILDLMDMTTETKKNDHVEVEEDANNGKSVEISFSSDETVCIVSSSSSSEDDEYETVVTKTRIPVILDQDQDIRDAFEGASHHHITDDYSVIDFTARIDDWLSCDKFEDWRQHQSYFTKASLTEQVSYELACFDVVSLLDGSFRVPKCLWDELFDYQRVGVEWLLKLHQENNGGVLGDEMGLGKTVQVVAYLAALQISGHMDCPGIVIAPSTLLRQWIRELNRWWPPLRTILLHSSSAVFNETKSVRSFLMSNYPKTHVFVTSYGTANSSGLQRPLTSCNWNFVVLDEGHKIRNPDSQVTLVCKQLQSYHRIALSGTPIQNNLTELWSLFDFVYPGRLGSLPLFKVELALPINIGGYANASLVQVQTSYRCACTLRDLISPYLLRRLKKNVLNSNNSNLPSKKEEIVFCQISPYQRKLYEKFIESEDVEAIMERKRNLLAGIDILRKICNHPDLLELPSANGRKFLDSSSDEEQDDEQDDDEKDYNYGRDYKSKSDSFLKVKSSISKPISHTERSGKMAVLEKILQLWKQQGHRALIFCQTRQMLNIIEEFLTTEEPTYRYLRMDGTTAIKQRLELVDRFNSSNSPYFLFLLTTRVGGLGINLTGADRVIIYDPDWNPSTDLQARERVYRLGQTRPVSILRLITAGTIEEKIYHRQIFKQFLTQRILEDPKQTRFFKAADLYDLFSLSAPTAEESNNNGERSSTTETGDLFAGLEDEISKRMNREKKRIKPNSEEIIESEDPVLGDLLNMVGVHSTLPTTNVTETVRPEIMIIQREADKIAKSALEALKRERTFLQKESTIKTPPTSTEHYNTFKPTWTGRFGSQVKFGSSSSSSCSLTDQQPASEVSAKEILDAIATRKEKRIALTAVNTDSSLKLALEIVDYFNRVGGSVESDRLAFAFRGQVQGAESAVLFRSLLKKIATFNKSTRKWSLSSDFSQNK